MENRFWASLRFCPQNYDHLETVGIVDKRSPLPRVRNNRYRFYGPIAARLPPNLRGPLKLLAGAFYRVIGTVSSVEQSIKKMDRKPVYDYQDNPRWQEALDFVCDMLDVAFKTTSVCTMEHLIETLVTTAASGEPWSSLGLTTKGKCLESQLFRDYLETMVLAKNRDHMKDPVWKIVPKTEWYPAEKLDANKCRTFIIPPFHLLFWQKFLYQMQNEAIKNVFWSVYGFNPYSGGVTRLANRLLTNKIFVYYDVVGWDRLLPVMPEIYNFRNLYIPPEYIELAWWVAKQTCESTLLHPDGYLLRKLWGNNSGSGTTTTDNIIGHCFVLSLALIMLYGTIDVVARVVAALFGDDNAMSLPYLEDEFRIQVVFEEVFSSFGLEFDPFIVTHTLEGVEFLGFTFTSLGDQWIPKYSIGRIASSFLYVYEKNVLAAAEISKMFILSVMSAGSGEETYSKFADVLTYVYSTYADSQDTVIASFVSMGVPTYNDVISFFVGTECNSFPWKEVDENLLLDEFCNWNIKSNTRGEHPQANNG